MVDFLLRGGIQFSPKDIDTKSIVKAVNAATSSIMVNITKIHLSDPVVRAFSQELERKIKIHIDYRNVIIAGADLASRIQKAIEGAGRKYLLDIVVNKQSLQAQIQSVLASMGAQVVPVKAVPAAVGTPANAPAGAATAPIAPAAATTAGLAAQVQAKAAVVQAEKDLLAATPQVVKSQEALNQILKNSGQSAEVFGAKMGQITSRFGAYLIAIKGIMVAQSAFTNSLQAIVQFDNVIQDLNKVLNSTPSQLQRVAEEMFQIANTTGKAFSDIGVAMNEFIRQGLGTAKALEMTRAAMIATNVSELDAAQATQFLTTASRVYEDTTKDTIVVLDNLTAAADASASTAGQVAEAFINSGAAAKSVGVSYQELFAITAATIDRLQQSGSRVGTALKTIFSRLVVMNSQIREQANAWGANIQAGDGVMEMFSKLAAIWDKLDIFQRGQLAYLVAGARRFTELAGILQGFGKAQQLLTVQQNSSGNAMRKNQIELDKLSTKGRMLTNTWYELIQVIAGTEGGAKGTGALRDTLGDILGLATDVSKGFLGLARALQSIEVGGANISTVFSAIAKTAFFTIGLTIIRGMISGLRQFFAIGELVQGLLVSLAQKQQIINQTTAQGNTIAQQGAQIQQQKNAQLEQAVALTQQQGVAAQQVAQASALLQKGQRGGGVAGGLKQLAILGTFMLAAQVVADNLKKLSESIKQSSGDFARFDTAIIDSAASAVNFGAILVATMGPVPGVIGGLLIGLTKLTLSFIEIEKASNNNLIAIQNEAKLRFSAEEATAAGASDLLVSAITEIAQGASDAQVGLGLAFSKAFADSSEPIKRAMASTAKVISELSEEVAVAIKSAEIKQTLKDFSEDFRVQMGAIDLKLQLGGPAGGFEDIIKSIAEAQGKIETLTSEQLTSEQLFKRMADASKVINLITKDEIVNSEELLNIYGLQSQQVLDLNEKLNSTRAEISDNDSILEEMTAKLDGLVADAKVYNDRWEENKKLTSVTGKGYEAVLETEKLVNQVAAQRQAAEQNIGKIQEQRQNLLAQENKLTEAIQKAVEKNVDALLDIVKAKDKILLATDLELKKIQLTTQQYAEQTKQAQRQIELRGQLVQMTLAPQDFGSEIARTLAEANGEAANAIAARRDEQLNAIKVIETSIIAAQAAGDQEAVASFQQRLEKMKSLFDKELAGLKSKLDVDVALKLQQDYAKAIQEGEQGLRDFRIERIRQVIDAERAAADRRISFIKEVASGPDFERVFRDQLRNLPNQLRDIFGDAGALVISEQQRISDLSVDALKTQYDETFSNVKASNQKIKAAQELSSQIIVEMEKNAALRRSTILDQVKNAAKKADDAESKLVEARNKIPALNAAIINAEKTLSDARQGYVTAVGSFFQASQAASDAQVQYNYEIEKARIGVIQATAGAGDFALTLSSLQSAWHNTITGIKASEEKILSIRSDIAQQAMSIYQQQFNALKGLTQRAATGTEEDLAKLRATIGAGKAVAAGTSVMNIPDELRSGLTQVASVIPGLEQAISEQGARLLGLDPGVFTSLESQMAESARVMAEAGKTNVDSAIKQVGLSMTQIAKADEQIRQAKEGLLLATKQRDFAESQVNQLSTANNIAHAQYSAEVGNATRQIDRLGSIDVTSKTMSETLKSINNNIQQMVKDLESSVASNRAALQSLAGGNIPNMARGSLSGPEIGGIISAARREKMAMPAGSRLMLANTSEVVLNRNQAARMNLRPIPRAYAADGNAEAVGSTSAATNALTTAVNLLVNKLSQPGLVEQNINVQVDTERTLNVRGMDAIDNSIRKVFTEKMSGVASEEEQKAVSETVKGLVERLHELNIVEARG